MDKSMFCDNLKLHNWDVKGNKLYSFINGFTLVISFEVIDMEQYDGHDEIKFEQDGLGFLLTIYSLQEKKKTFCAFTSLQEMIYFINSYIKKSKTIRDIDEMFVTYRISDDAKNRNIYS